MEQGKERIRMGFKITMNPRFPVLFILSVFLLPLNSWGQLNDYTYYKSLTIDNTQVKGTEDLINFPVLISITDLDLRTTGNSGRVENASGYDIIFAKDANCLSTFDHQLESYNPVTGLYLAWVRLDTVFYNSDTEFYMYYGNSAIGSDQSTASTWNSHYKGVWHLHDDFLDGTSNNNDGTNDGSTDITAVIGDGQDFDGSDDVITIPDDNSLDITGELSIEFWMYKNGGSLYNIAVSKTSSGSPNNYYMGTYNDELVFGFLSGSWRESKTPAFNLSEDVWYHYVSTYNDAEDTVRLYMDGVQVLADYESSSLLTNTKNLLIGRNYSSEDFHGILDEIRISDTILTAGWIGTEYNNQSSPGTFYTLGTEQTTSCVPLPIELLYFNAELIGDKGEKMVKTTWTTASEINNDYFVIERTHNGIDFIEVGKISGAGNSNEVLNYQLIDPDPLTAASYYRLKQVDYDAAYSYSKLVAVNLELANIISIFPNPSKELFSFILGASESIEVTISIINVLGEIVQDKSMLVESGISTHIINTHRLNSGMYYLIISSSLGDFLSQKSFLIR